MVTSIAAGESQNRNQSPEKNVLPFMSATSVHPSGDLVGQVFSIKGFRELAMITPAGMQADGATGIEVRVSTTIDGSFGIPEDFPTFTPVAATIGFFQTGVVLAPWNYAQIVIIGASTVDNNIPYNLT